MQDIGVISKTDSTNVIDRSKLRRERKKQRKEVVIQSKEDRGPLHGLYFDGRKDQTRSIKNHGSTLYPISFVEEHVSLIKEPDSEYLGHMSPKDGSANAIEKSIMDFLHENDICTKDLIAVGCDGTNVNTGIKGGTIRLLEETLGRPLHWFICLLHANELPLRHLLQYVDGSTSGPKAFLGPIGRALQN